MKTTEINRSLIGKRCRCMFTGMMVTGTIVDIKDERNSTNVKVRYDEPHQWGEHTYEDGWAWGRKSDEFGTLQHLTLLQEPSYDAMVVIFSDSISRIGRMFDDPAWGVATLKEWVDNYEGTRFTPIGRFTAVITSQDNMTFVREWLEKNTPIENIIIK